MASLCTLRLLNQLDDSEVAEGHIKCVAFAAPALGNRALAEIVQQQGWSHVFYNLTLPGEHVLAAPRVCIGGFSLATIHGQPQVFEQQIVFIQSQQKLGCACWHSLSRSVLANSQSVLCNCRGHSWSCRDSHNFTKTSCLLSVCIA